MPPPVKTVDRFGISVTGSQGQGPLHQPKLRNRFRVLFLGFGGAGNGAAPLTLNANTCSLPHMTTEDKEIHSYNSIAYYAGKASWGTIELSVRDTVDNTVAKVVGAQLQRQMDHYNQTGYRAGQDYKFTMQIQMLNGGHDTANVAWTGEGCFLSDVNWGETDYASTDPINITMTVRADNWIEESLEGQNSIFASIPVDPLGSFIDS